MSDSVKEFVSLDLAFLSLTTVTKPLEPPSRKLLVLEFEYQVEHRDQAFISHDILDLGVRKAFDEFFNNKPEPVIESFAAQAMVVKTYFD